MFSGLFERHLGPQPRVPELPQEQPDEGSKVEQGRTHMACQRRARAKEGTGKHTFCQEMLPRLLL